ncbi:hypothetical protein FRB93_006007 [Tulasnella sp. JGI-2019a]|nr:hypothetical protein FRB93_006007 [Tulasnella sp. JGI-2019a]
MGDWLLQASIEPCEGCLHDTGQASRINKALLIILLLPSISLLIGGPNDQRRKMHTERAPFRNPYEKFTGTDLDSFVSSIREKVGNALKPPRRPSASGTSRDYDISISIDDRSRFSANTYDDAVRDETSSPIPPRDKGKGRALEEDTFESYNEVSDDEKDQVLATLGGQTDDEAYSDGEEKDVARYKKYYGVEEEEDAEEDAAEEDEVDEAHPEAVEVHDADDEEDASERDEAADSDRELSPDAVEHTHGGKDYNVDDDGAILIVDSDDEDGDTGGRLQSQRSPEWAVDEGFEEGVLDGEEPEYQVEEESDELREEDDLPGEYALEPQYDEEEADELDEEQVSVYPVDRAEEFIDLETDVVHGQDDTFLVEDDAAEDEDAAEGGENDLDHDQRRSVGNVIEESSLAFSEPEMRQVAAELVSSGPQPFYSPATAGFAQTNFTFPAPHFPSQFDPTVASAFAVLQQFSSHIPPLEQPFDAQEFNNQVQSYGHLDGLSEFNAHIPSFNAGVGVTTYPELPLPSPYPTPGNDVIDVDALDDDSNAENQAAEPEAHQAQECSNIWLADDESSTNLLTETTSYGAGHQPLSDEAGHSAIYLEDEEDETTGSIVDSANDLPSRPLEPYSVAATRPQAPGTSVDAELGDSTAEQQHLNPVEGDGDLSIVELVGQAISSADALTEPHGNVRTVDDVLRDFAAQFQPVEAADSESSMVDVTNMLWEGISSIQEVIAPNVVAVREGDQLVDSALEDGHPLDTAAEPAKDRELGAISPIHSTRDMLHDTTITLQGEVPAVIHTAQEDLTSTAGGADAQMNAASETTELVEGVHSVTEPPHEVVSTSLGIGAEHTALAAATVQETSSSAIDITKEAVTDALTSAHDAPSTIVKAVREAKITGAQEQSALVLNGAQTKSPVIEAAKDESIGVIGSMVSNSALAASEAHELVGGVRETTPQARSSVHPTVTNVAYDAQEALTSVASFVQDGLSSTQDQALGIAQATNGQITQLAREAEVELPSADDVIESDSDALASTTEVVISTSHAILRNADEMANDVQQIGSPMITEGQQDVMSTVQAAREAALTVSTLITAARDQTYEVMIDMAPKPSSLPTSSQDSPTTMVQESQDKVAQDALTHAQINTPITITSPKGAALIIPNDLAAFIKDTDPPAADTTSALFPSAQAEPPYRETPMDGPAEDRPRFLFPKPSLTHSDSAVAEQLLSTNDSQSDAGLDDPFGHMGNGLGGPGEVEDSDLTTSPDEDEDEAEAEDMANVENALKLPNQSSSNTTKRPKTTVKGKHPAHDSNTDDQEDQTSGVPEENTRSAPRESDTGRGIGTETRSREASTNLASSVDLEANDYDDIDGTDFASSSKEVSHIGHQSEGSPEPPAPSPLPRRNSINLYTHHHGPLPPRVEVKVPEPDIKIDVSPASTTSTTAGTRPRSTHNKAPSVRDPNAVVTRSHCTFRKVSIPICKPDENNDSTAEDQVTTAAAGDDNAAPGSSTDGNVAGPSAQPDPDQPIQRTCFIVPGCALSAFDVVKDDDIEDLGEATKAENDSKIPDFGLAPIDPSVFAALHRLVGHDFVNDTACAWLPSPEERAAFDAVLKEYRHAEASQKHNPTLRYAESSLDTPVSRRLGRKSTASRYKVVLREGGDSSSAGPSSSQQSKQRRHRRRYSTATNGTTKHDDSDYEEEESAKGRRAGHKPASSSSPIPTVKFLPASGDEDGRGSDVDGTSSLTRSASLAASAASSTQAPPKVVRPRSPRYSVRLGKRNADQALLEDRGPHEESDSDEDAEDAEERPTKRARRSTRIHGSTTTAKPLSLQKSASHPNHAEEKPSSSKSQGPAPTHWLRSTSTTPTAKPLSPQKSLPNPAHAEEEPSNPKGQDLAPAHWLRSVSVTPSSSPEKGKKRGASELVGESKGKSGAHSTAASQSPRKRRRVATGGKAAGDRETSVVPADDDRLSVRSSVSSHSTPRGDTVEVVINASSPKLKGRRGAAK